MSGLAKREVPKLGRFFGPHPIWQLRQGMEEAFENLLGENNPFHPGAEIIPEIDISETDNVIQVLADLPGYTPGEVDIEINDHYLTFSGSHEEDDETKEEDGVKYHRIERRAGRFSRTVALPCSVKQDDVHAELKDGVLTISLPKAEEACCRKVIVKAAGQD